ncbi:NADH dehydrogenase ubiquinone Fe-S protein 4 [Leisingera aquaemixtae]|uniref:Uncharacterized protein n=1 Tax=Leisingera aquaemixtae TaxID=1396826 RepID=A0A0P1H8T7_9RHOB|nr:NADH dehydrogenase ubiquinone Fe-S protein 4 [Leisingera aquaemixtae]CUH99413.1 hypothetical protein PHA8399_01534 [Leisingera aquaemixtae]
MGWTSSDDPFQTIRLTLPDRKSAIAYAERNYWRYIVHDDPTTRRGPAPRRFWWEQAPSAKGFDAPGAWYIITGRHPQRVRTISIAESTLLARPTFPATQALVVRTPFWRPAPSPFPFRNRPPGPARPFDRGACADARNRKRPPGRRIAAWNIFTEGAEIAGGETSSDPDAIPHSFCSTLLSPTGLCLRAASWPSGSPANWRNAAFRSSAWSHAWSTKRCRGGPA